jgi:hypothetical protein
VERGRDNPLLARLADRGEAICRVWLDRALAVYSEEYGRFARENPDPFTNPIGAVLKSGIEALWAALLDGVDTERYCGALEPIVRIKAVQEASPSTMLAFVPMLKSIIRDELPDEMHDPSQREAMWEFEKRVDWATMVAFDLYTECRERIFQLRVNELKRNTARLLRPNGAQPCAAHDSKEGECP